MSVKEVLAKLRHMQVELSTKRKIRIDIPQINLKEQYKVESTMNYKMFKLMEANRDIDHERAVTKCMIMVGLLPIPVIVNEFHEIADGQGRYKACKELGFPVYYMEVPGLRIDHVRRINFAMTRWNQNNYVKSYSNDHVDYAYLQNLKTQFPKYTNRVLDVAAGRSLTGGNIHKTIQYGNYKMTASQYDDAVKVLTWMEQFSSYLDNRKIIAGKKENLHMAIIYAYRNPSIDKKRFAKMFFELASQTERKEMSLQSAGDIKDCLKRLENMYNFRISNEKRVFLLSDYERDAQIALNRKE